MALGIAVAVLLLSARESHAATLVVTTATDPGPTTCAGAVCSLRGAILTAAPNDTIAFGIPATDPRCTSPNVCTIVLDQHAGPLLISKNLIIDGRTQDVTLDGSGRQLLILNLGATLRVNALTFTHAFCTGNCPGSNGSGAITNVMGGSLAVTNSKFIENSVGFAAPPSPDPLEGSAIYSEGSLTVASSTFTRNSSPGGGGAIYSFGSLTIIGSTFVENSAGPIAAAGVPFGGAIDVRTGGNITASTFYKNTAQHTGGAIVHSAAPSDLLAITNSTFAGNFAGEYGGAVTTQGGLTLVVNSTLSGNAGGSKGGQVANNVGSVTLSNTVLANDAETGGSCAITAPTVATFRPITDGGGNVSDDGTCNFTRATSRNHTNAVLGPMANNGGPTQTLALLAGSPAISLGVPGSCPAVDQRGVPRPGAGQACSSGAFQYVMTLTLACPAAAAEVGVPYSSALTASGGVSPYGFLISGGSLPPGLTLTPTTGVITGTPGSPGTYSYTGQITDSSGFASGTVAGACSITVAPRQPHLTEVPNHLSFGQVSLFSLRTRSVLVANTGGMPVAIASVSLTPFTPLSGREFFLASSCPASLGVGQSCAVGVTFVALGPGNQAAAITIRSDAAGSPQSIPLDAGVIP
jgi:predicted outer membrane repeat protein